MKKKKKGQKTNHLALPGEEPRKDVPCATPCPLLLLFLLLSLKKGFLHFYRKSDSSVQYRAVIAFPSCVDPFDTPEALGRLMLCNLYHLLHDGVKTVSASSPLSSPSAFGPPLSLFLPRSQCRETLWSHFCPHPSRSPLSPWCLWPFPPSRNAPLLRLPGQ